MNDFCGIDEMTDNDIAISIVCPAHNEADVIDLFIDEIFSVLNDIKRPFEVIFINDGSTDSTLEKLIRHKTNKNQIRIISLSRNFGKEAALTAGLNFSRGNAVVPIDADLQDPPELIKSFVAKWDDGYDVVLAKRVDRSTDSFFKRKTAELFYSIHNKISYIRIPENVGDFRLMTRAVVDAVQKLPENQRFMKGVFAWVGFKTAIVEYKRNKREAGKSNFNGWKLWNFAIDGITGFSTIPLRIWLYMGLFISALSFGYGSIIVLKTLWLGVEVPGYASLLTVILFLGGIQLIGIGVIGEYIGRLYMEAKRRPSYVVEKVY